MFKLAKSIVNPNVSQIGFRWCQRRFLSQTAKTLGVFEPSDLKLVPDIPEYEEVIIQMKGFDYVVLESFSKYVHQAARCMGMDTECWPSPPKCLKVQTFKPNSSIVDKSFDMKEYIRTVQLDDVPSPQLPILVELISIHAPEGVNITVKKFDPVEDESRYVPDKDKRILKEQIEEIEKARRDRRK